MNAGVHCACAPSRRAVAARVVVLAGRRERVAKTRPLVVSRTARVFRVSGACCDSIKSQQASTTIATSVRSGKALPPTRLGTIAGVRKVCDVR